MEAIVASNLSKSYPNGKQALNSVSLSIAGGEVFGFLGPNGAGKTTTVKLLTGMLSPTAGSCGVFGFDPHKQPEKVHAFSGVVTEHAQMYDSLTGLENLVFYGKLFGVDSEEIGRRAVELLERLDLTEAKDQKLAGYSTGMRQRLSLARAMMHRPRLLFLDEPTSGLDPESALSVNRLIRSLATEEGTTVFLCTHQLRYAQEVCTKYGLLDEGTLLAAGSLDALRSLVFSGLTVTIRADHLPAGLSACEKDGGFEIDVRSEEEIPGIVRRVVENGGSLYHISARSLSLEEIYFALIERQKTKDGSAR